MDKKFQFYKMKNSGAWTVVMVVEHISIFHALKWQILCRVYYYNLKIGAKMKKKKIGHGSNLDAHQQTNG